MTPNNHKSSQLKPNIDFKPVNDLHNDKNLPQSESQKIRECGIVCAYVVNNLGQASPIQLQETETWQPSHGEYLWLHFDIRNADARYWLTSSPILPDIAKQTLLAEETRPHVWYEDESLVMALRSVNLNPHAQPEDMVAVRVFADSHKIITARRRSLVALRDLAEGMAQGVGPNSVAAMVAAITSRLTNQLVDAIDTLEDQMDELEAAILENQLRQSRVRVMALRRKCIILRRYLAPQREALNQLFRDSVPWIDEDYRFQQRNIADQLVRYVETLDAVKDRATVVQEELANRSADQLNKRMYVLSLVAAFFLPMSFILTVFDLQIGGKPLTEYSYGFGMLCVIMAITFVVQIVLFRKKGWL